MTEEKERTTWFFGFEITYGLWVGVKHYKCCNCHVPLPSRADCRGHALWHVRNMPDERGMPLSTAKSEGRPNSFRIKIIRAMHGGLEVCEG